MPIIVPRRTGTTMPMTNRVGSTRLNDCLQQGISRGATARSGQSKVYKRVSAKKRTKPRDSLHKASHLRCHKLAASSVVVGDLSQRKLFMKEHPERTKSLNRAVYNGWGLDAFMPMLSYKCPL